MNTASSYGFMALAFLTPSDPKVDGLLWDRCMTT
jgi:hypothetical protein